MKKTQLIELVMNIKRTIVSYCSIGMFVMLGLAIFIGITAGTDSLMYNAEQKAFVDGNMHDLEIISPFGFTDEDIDSISSQEGIDEIEGVRYSFEYVSYNGLTDFPMVYQLPEHIDTLLSCEGRLPEKPDEIAIDKNWADDNDAKLGDIISIKNESSALEKKEFVITAFVTSPLFLFRTYRDAPDSDVAISTFMMVDESAWTEQYASVYTEAVVRSDLLRSYSVFDKDYEAAADRLSDSLKYVLEDIDAGKVAYSDSDAETVISNAHNNSSMLSFHTAGMACDIIKWVFSIMFIGVGLLICYSCLTRLVFDQMIQIGTKKALGLTANEITRSYLLYSGSSALIGCILSIPVANIIAIIFILVLVGNMFGTDLQIILNYKWFIIVSLTELALVLHITHCACASTLKKKAKDLLEGPLPPSGKERAYEKTKVWDRISVLGQSVINNFVNDKKRVLATLVGITSCTTLLVMALTLHINALKGARIQQNEYYKFNTIVYFDDSVQGIRNDIKDKIPFEKSVPARIELIDIDVPEDFLAAYMIVPEDRDRYSYFSDMKPFGESYGRADSGVWLNSSYINFNGGDNHQIVEVTNSRGDEVEIPVKGFFYNYSGFGEMVMSPDDYEQYFDDDYNVNCFIINSNSYSYKEIDRMLQDLDGYRYTADFLSIMDDNFMFFRLLCATIVGISIILAIIMDFLILLNLLFMYVSEKKKELIVLMINGYSLREAKKYVSSDTIVLTIIGVALGLVAGCFAGEVCLSSIESSTFYFLHGISVQACIIGSVITVILIIISARMAFSQIDNFELCDINK